MKTLGTISTDTSGWPLVLVRFSDEEGHIADEAYQAFFESIDGILRRRSQFALLTDIRMSAPASATQRRMLTEWLKVVEAPTKHWAVGVAIVVRSAIIRGALRAVFWIKESAAPTRVVGSLQEGAEFCLAQLEARGVADAQAARLKWKSHGLR